MAGWDGDALAGQMEDAMNRAEEAAEERRRSKLDAASPEERARRAEQESVRLSRARVAAQLTAATNPAHRAMLERALKSLDEQLAG